MATDISATTPTALNRRNAKAPTQNGRRERRPTPSFSTLSTSLVATTASPQVLDRNVIAMRPEPLVGATHNIIPIPAPEIGQRTCNQRFAHDRAASGVSHRHESRSFINDGMSSDEIKRLFGPVGMDAPVTRGNFDDIAAFLGHDRNPGGPRSFQGSPRDRQCRAQSGAWPSH
jgi:hypothetical protein